MIPIQREATAGTSMNTNAQIFLDNLTAARTHLASVARIDLHRTSTSILSFVQCELRKLIPCGIADGLGETMIFEHPANVEILKYNDCKSIDELSALLMSEVATLVGDTFVYVRDGLAPLVSLWTAFRGCAQSPKHIKVSLSYHRVSRAARLSLLKPIGLLY